MIKIVLLAAVLLAAISAGFILDEEETMTQPMLLETSTLPVEGRLPSLTGATGWLNSKPLTPAELRGKVVLVEFWTYSCINWLRVQPYVRAWSEKYRDHGLVVIGVHTPEFGFEKNLDNIRWATRHLRVDYPIAIDSDYAVWRAFDNHYWPAFYFVDAEGRIRHHQFGEGNYEESEAVIQQLLSEAGRNGFDAAPVQVEGLGVETAADWDNLGSPETYLGYGRTDNFLSPGGVSADAPALYTIPERLLPRNYWAFAGNWTIRLESATLNGADGRIAFRFHARDVNLVMGPAAPDAPVKFRVRIDGNSPGADAGVDVDADGNGVVAEQRLYQLVRQGQPIVDRTVEIEFLDPGVQLFVFTFG
jgi:thiol-disulfide isomerase/thioredoxin